MHTSVTEIVKEALEVQSDVFTELVDDTAELLRQEHGRIHNLTVQGKLVEIEPQGEALIIGDLHGDLESLIDILKQSDFPHKLEHSRDNVMILLGDYGDRGAFSIEVYYTVLNLKLLFPEQVVLMRGNHEGPENLPVEPEDMPEQLQARFGEKWVIAYRELRRMFEYLYAAALVKERYLLVHGGLPPKVQSLDDLAFAGEKSYLEDLLWSDPDKSVDFAVASPRGAGELFGRKVTDEVLRRLNVRVMVRGHEPCEDGYKIDHGGKILTLFSCKIPPYFNAHGAYLDIELSKKLDNAEQLIPYLHTF